MAVEDLIAILEAAGFACRRGRRGHWLCEHALTNGMVNIPEPHGREPYVLRDYVSAALELLDEVRERQREMAQLDREQEDER